MQLLVKRKCFNSTRLGLSGAHCRRNSVRLRETKTFQNAPSVEPLLKPTEHIAELTAISKATASPHRNEFNIQRELESFIIAA